MGAIKISTYVCIVYIIHDGIKSYIIGFNLMWFEASLKVYLGFFSF